MNSRALDLLDLPSLYQHRHEVIPLDSLYWLTEGNPLSARRLIRQLYLAPGYRIGCVDGPSGRLVGAIAFARSPLWAALQFVAPAGAVDLDSVRALERWWALQAVGWQRPFVRAEVAESAPLRPVLQMLGFTPWAWLQTLICLDKSSRVEADRWRPAAAGDLRPVRSLQRMILPEMLRRMQTEHPLKSCWVWTERDEVLACAWVRVGPQGVALQPLCRADFEQAGARLLALAGHWQRLGLPVYVQVPSYQGWLLSALEDTTHPYGERQILLIKNLAARVPLEARDVQRALGAATPLVS